MSNNHQKTSNTVQNLIRVIGQEATDKLIKAYGGNELAVPAGRNDQGLKVIDEIAGHIGQEAAQKLCAEYASEYVYIPLMAAFKRNERNKAIHAEFDEAMREGISANQAVRKISLEHHLSNRNIWKILKELPT